MNLKLFTLFSLVSLTLFAGVKDWTHPKRKEIRKLQKELLNGERPLLQRLSDPVEENYATNLNYAMRVREFRFFSRRMLKMPEIQTVCYNDNPYNKKKCVITYASLNRNYAEGVHRMKRQLKNVGFDGHLLYMIGGWPNIEEGDLELIDVPYAFKVAFFRAAKRMGYEQVLWLDSAIKPVKSLDPVFDSIQKTGFFLQGNDSEILTMVHKATLGYFGISCEEASHYRMMNSGLFGLDLSKQKPNMVLDEWYKAAKSRDGFYSPLPDQIALSLILNKNKLTKYEFAPCKTHVKRDISDKTLFFQDWNLVH
ncbi:MAG: hypothetical protein SP1CHLAM54_14760 [Chlamydiia bacterium]|nr:hypothetical protein [Chlamydiia bacterium]MCH9616366.1 hypothetical protein [Chlamydiia bacterium]MCH9629648.1 hypothetical protein [Chlamydiia bacterium]